MSDTSTPGHDTSRPLDPTQVEYLRRRMAEDQSLLMGTLAGIVACLIGAGAWAFITVVTGYQIGFMALGVGFLVGAAVRMIGKGVDKPFGFIGAGLSLLGCALGNLFAACAMFGAQEGVSFFQVLSSLDMNLAGQMLFAFFSPIDMLFYALAIYEGYKLSFRQVSEEEMHQMLTGTSQRTA